MTLAGSNWRRYQGVAAEAVARTGVAPATFQSNADGLFYDCFFLCLLAKGETGNPFWPPGGPAGRRTQYKDVSHIGIGKQNVANSTTRHSNELVVIVRNGRAGCVSYTLCGIAFALRFIGLPDRRAVLRSRRANLFSGHCQSNHI